MQWLPIALRMNTRDHSLSPVWPGPCYFFCLVYHSPSSWFLPIKHTWLLPSSGRNLTHFHPRRQFTILPLPQIPGLVISYSFFWCWLKCHFLMKAFPDHSPPQAPLSTQASFSSLIFTGNDILTAIRSWLMFLPPTGVNVIPHHFTPCTQHSACHIPGAR